MAGLVPAIHAKTLRQTSSASDPNHVDARPKAGHDAAESDCFLCFLLAPHNVKWPLYSRARRFICFFPAARKVKRQVAYEPPLAAAWAAPRFFSTMRTA
jgi:hypothetical protein